jgi:predicted dehydrogenase
MNKIRFGITGSGYMGRTHAEAIKHLGAQAALVSVWGGSRAPAMAQMFGATCEASLEAMVKRTDIDAIVVTTPHALHHNEVMQALRSGKHVLVEKPMAITVADCDEMLAEAAKRKLVIATAYNSRFRTNPPKVRELIRSGAIGRVQSMHYSMIRRMDDNFGGNKFQWINRPDAIGFLIDGLPHGVDMMRWFTGAEIVKVSGFSRSYIPNRTLEDTTVGVLEFSDGAVCSVHCTNAAAGPYPREGARLSIIGSAGLIDMDAFGDTFLSDKQGGWRHVSTQPAVPFDDPEKAFTTVGRMQAFYDQMQSFVDGINGKPMVAGNGPDGRAGVVVSLALMQASAENRVISLT